MKYRSLNRLWALSAICVLSMTASYAQNNGKSFGIWLTGGAGVGVWNCYDNGTIPFSYAALAADLNFGVTAEWKRCHIQTDFRATEGVLFTPTGSATSIDYRTEFLYRCYDGKRNRLHLLAGGGLQGFYDLKVIPSMNNASTGISVFGNLCAQGMVQYDFAFIRGGTHNLLTVYGKLSLPLVGIALRPGFAYMDNYTSQLALSNTILSNYETFGIAFPGVGTDIGLRFNLPNGNRVGLSYRWDYLTTRDKAIYRFDNACHTLNITLMFNLH